ncbi:hypothetical protein AVEN_222676-1 [Araneus ventricosus]|uniref:Uncharacterized protein n=1 Tax=Araneus ventricosus TaxID=182803 RepID=A0A4Y2AZ83_ARAVE|nr:hypothetical protein AVEN_222676-1 [Araneus ventricosus]
MLIKTISNFGDAFIGFAVAGVLPLILYYAVKSKICSIQHILKRYGKFKFFRFNTLLYRQSKSTNFATIIILISTVLASTASTLTLADENQSKLYYSFFINFENDTFGFSVGFCMNQLYLPFLHTFPCIIATMVGVLYYEFSVFLHLFEEILQTKSMPLNGNNMKSEMKIYPLLYEVAHKLQNATSSICFILLCCQLAVMYCFLAVLIRTKTEDFTVHLICEGSLVLTLVPESTIGIVFCSSRITSQYQKMQITLSLLRDKLSLQNNYELETLHVIKFMIEKKFPVMSGLLWGNLHQSLY